MEWSQLPSMTRIRDRSQAGLITDQNGNKGILAAGGDEVSSVEYLDLQTLIWEPRANLPYDISDGASVPYQDSFLIVGGFSSNSGIYLDSIQYYNPNLDRWEMLPQSLGIERNYPTAFLVPDSYANCV